MKTSEWIGVLARGAGPAPKAVAATRLTSATVCGVAVAVAAAISMFGMVPTSMFTGPALWTKLVYALALCLAGGCLAERLSRPAAHARAAWCSVALVVAGMGLVGGLALATMPSTARAGYLFGSSWASCPWSVMLLSMPALAGILWVMRGMALTDLARAGFAGGVLAGATGALGYSLACPEESLAFVALWYTLGIALTGIAGALLGRRVLRW